MLQHYPERVVGTFEGGLPGPLIIVIAALHGNEPAGVQALEMVFEALEQERRDNPDFHFQGKLVGLIGNAQAYLLRQRFIEQDLNRMWTADLLEGIKSSKQENLSAESLEVLHLFEYLSAECQSSTSETIVFLDLHTTSAEGGVFCIPTDEGESLRLAKHLGAPSIVGLQASITGTLLGFAKEGGFTSHPAFAKASAGKQSTNPPITIPLCVAFEAGQHESPHAVSRSVIVMVRCLRAMHCVASNDLAEFSENLTTPFMTYVPPVVRFRYAHHIEASDEFKMRLGYSNFQPIQQGEHLADDVHGPVLSPENGLILMPLYQPKGSDGFFIVQ
ncbi:MAG: succinylglutamate desuccinylase/aspartoacylase family protein [Saprospiraceae bacterium]